MITKGFIEKEVVKYLKTVYDPEIPVDIYELGLIYSIIVNEDFSVDVTMTLTAPNCPVADSMPNEVKEKVEEIPQVTKATVELTFDPPWDRSMMSDEAKLELNLF